MLILDAADVWRSLPMREAIAAMHDALTAVSEDRAVLPLRSHIGVPAHDGTALVMPALTGGEGQESLAVKIVSVYPGNRDRGLPTINAVVVALDPRTGRPAALLEGGALTAIRTAAASGAATRALARADAKTLAILGAGVQAHSHALAMSAVRDLREIRVWARSASRAGALAGRLRRDVAGTRSIRVATSPEEAVAGAGLVCTTTAAERPLFDAGAVAPGTHINAVGAFQPHMQEIPDRCVARARVFVDQEEAALAEAGDLLGPMRRGVVSRSHIVGEVGAVLAGRLTGRRDDAEVTLFKSVGNAAQDAIAAATALGNARRDGLGREIDL